MANKKPPENPIKDTVDNAQKPSKVAILDGGGGEKEKTQVTRLIEIGQGYSLFHDSENEAYAKVGKAVYKLKSKDFREVLSHEYYKQTQKGCNDKFISDALSTLVSIAKYDNPQHSVHLRTANLGDTIFIDIGCPDWRVIQVAADGWCILDESPVKFIRKRGFAALPEPERGGSVAELAEFISLSDGQFALVYGFVLCALAGVSPYPILVVEGLQGSGKSTASRAIRAFVDPSTVLLRQMPKESRDIAVSAINSACLAYDNLSGLSAELSDCLCAISTGSGLDLRTLYTDTEQTLINLKRPIIINGIDNIATRSDMAERSFIINLSVIEDDERKSETAFWEEFDTAKGRIFGGILDALTAGLKHKDTINLPFLPRMADATLWITACEQEFFTPIPFFAAHTRNQTEAMQTSIEASPVGSAIMAFMSNNTFWSGTPKQLYDGLSDEIGEKQSRAASWPKSPTGMGKAIKRLMHGFRRLGLQIDQVKGGNREYTIARNDPAGGAP